MVAPSLLAVIGDPIAHSLSPLIHQTIYEQEGIAAAYLPVRVARGGLPAFLQAAGTFDVKGFNATMPHKQVILPYLKGLDPEARRFGSANTLKRVEGGYMGYTTDGPGLKRALEEGGISFYGRRILVLGAGGVTPTVAVTAALAGAQAMTILNRHAGKAEAMAGLTGRLSGLTPQWGGMDGAPSCRQAQGFDLVVNTTPLGMAGFDDFTDFAFLDALAPGAAVVDLIYHPFTTSLLAAAQARGLQAVNGLGMLAWQAFFAHEIWFGSLPGARTRQLVLERLRTAGGR